MNIIVKPGENGGLSITMYRKPTHTDQYLQWDSHHNLSAKFRVINTLSHRAKTVCSNPELLKQEKEQLQGSSHPMQISQMGFGQGGEQAQQVSSEAIDGVNNQGSNGTSAATREVKSKGHIVIPYTQGLCESIKKICGRNGIQTHFKAGSTIKNLLVSPKDKDPMISQSDAFYWYQCGDLACDDEYIGKTSRTFGERYKEHLKDPSPIHHHNNQTIHPINHNNFKIIVREGHHLSRYIKESISIRVNNPTLNNNVGKFNLPHIWDRDLINTPGLKLNK